MGHAAFLVLWLLVAVPAGSAEAKPPTKTLTADQAYHKARALYAQKKYSEALKWLEVAHRKKPRAIYIYNQGRLLEALGRLREAHNAFLSAQAMPQVSDELRELAAAQAAKVKSLVDVAVVRFSGLSDNTLVQVDGEVVSDVRQDLTVPEAKHQLCVSSPRGDRVRCWNRKLRAGIRVVAPFKGGARGLVKWPARAHITRLHVDGHDLLVDLKNLRFIELDAGRHLVRVTLMVAGAGPQVHEQSVDVLPTRPATLTLKKKAPIDVGVGGGVKTPVSPGAWPWVVTGTGVAVLGVGVGLMVKASADRGVDPSSEAAGRGVVTQKTQVAHEAAWDDADSLSGAGAAMTAVGGAALIGGLTWWLMTRSASEKKKPQVSAARWCWACVSAGRLGAGGRGWADAGRRRCARGYWRGGRCVDDRAGRGGYNGHRRRDGGCCRGRDDDG